jgi:two-component system, NarL family, invasion response regulator UvrY
MRPSGIVTRSDPRGEVMVLAVDDHPRFLEAAKAVVDATPGFGWAGGVSSGAEALSVAAESEPDLMLVDVNMPEMDGFELVRELDCSHPQTLVALISAQHPDELPRAPDGSARRPVLTKENLRPDWLRALWQEHRGMPPPAK